MRRRSEALLMSALLALPGTLALSGPLALPPQREEQAIKLDGGAQATLVQLRCSTCHSLDYIVMNSPFLTHAAWEAEVRKMMKAMGAPIPESDVAPIADYLTQYYGAR
jgi:hypothetical protein